MTTQTRVDSDIEELLGSITDSQKVRRVVMFNDDHHGMEEVMLQVVKAIKCTQEAAMKLMLQAHLQGQAVVFTGPLPECKEVRAVLEEIDLATDIIE